MQQVALSQANTSLPSSFYLLDLRYVGGEGRGEVVMIANIILVSRVMN